jgi:hypothetical protein
VSVREVRVARLLFDTGPVAESGLVHGVRASVAVLVDMLARADGHDGAEAVSGSHDRVTRARRTMHEVPLTQGPFLAFDDQERPPDSRRKSS